MPIVLQPSDWRARERAHADRANLLTRAARERRSAGQVHPVEDFLYDYYGVRFARLARWHPGVGVVLAAADRAEWRWYRPSGPGVVVDQDAFMADRGKTVRAIRHLLARIESRPPFLGCFCLHEWAMVYRDDANGRPHRHPLPLRLGPNETDAVVEANAIRCTHADAYRFFTPEAAPRNALRPTRVTQPQLDQGGCLHANMDLYKWAVKLSPAVPGELVLDAFDLALRIRYLDARASAYDLSSLGLDPVRVETPEGKAQFVRAQRGFADEAALLRRRILGVCDRLVADEA